MAPVDLQHLVQKGAQLHQAGQLRDASAIYDDILRHDPAHADANNLSGLIALGAGEYEKAVQLLSRAINTNPKIADFHYNQGMAFHELGRLAEAVSSYREAIAINPDFVAAHSDLGAALREMGQPEDAVSSFRRALVGMPDDAEGHSNLGVALHESGRLEEATAHHRKALALKPDYAEAHSNLGNVLKDMGRLEEAAASQNRALALNPDLTGAHTSLGHTLKQLGRLPDAIAHYCMAVSLSPQIDAYWDALADCLGLVTFTSANDALLDILLQLLERPTTDPHGIAQAVISALRHQADFARLLAKYSAGGDENGIDCAEAVETLSAIPLLSRLLELGIIKDPEVEGLLTCLRRFMLAEVVAGRDVEKGSSFAAALALQCFTNEYVFFVTAEETAAVEQLHRNIGASIADGTNVQPAHICVLAAYLPLSGFPWAAELLHHEWPDDVAKIITRQVLEPEEERALLSQIERVTPIRDSVSQSVRDQYEDHPYPRWTRTSLYRSARSIGEILHDISTVRMPADYVSPADPDILVAGCGTGRQALTAASRYLNARVLAVDLSLSSLAHAIRKTRELGISNIEYAQADIMELGALARRFDLIESVGVLHHLGEPLAGWRVLLSLLRPGGLMKIGLYSEIARRSVVSARATIAEQGYDASTDGIRRYRHDIMQRRNEPDLAEIVGASSFYSLSECCDYLFHVQEHRFNLPMLQSALNDLGLTFLGFEIDDPVIMKRFTEKFPDPEAAVSLPLWHAFEQENPVTFRGMYRFWCQKT